MIRRLEIGDFADENEKKEIQKKIILTEKDLTKDE